MELMKCGLCGGHPCDQLIRGMHTIVYCMSCKFTAPASNIQAKSSRGKTDPSWVEAATSWNDIQTKLARLEYLEAMLESKDAAAGKTGTARL